MWWYREMSLVKAITSHIFTVNHGRQIWWMLMTPETTASCHRTWQRRTPLTLGTTTACRPAAAISFSDNTRHASTSWMRLSKLCAAAGLGYVRPHHNGHEWFYDCGASTSRQCSLTTSWRGTHCQPATWNTRECSVSFSTIPSSMHRPHPNSTRWGTTERVSGCKVSIDKSDLMSVLNAWWLCDNVSIRVTFTCLSASTCNKHCKYCTHRRRPWSLLTPSVSSHRQQTFMSLLSCWWEHTMRRMLHTPKFMQTCCKAYQDLSEVYDDGQIIVQFINDCYWVSHCMRTLYCTRWRVCDPESGCKSSVDLNRDRLVFHYSNFLTSL